MLFDMEELNKKLNEVLKESLDNGVPIVYADKKYTKDDEMIKSFQMAEEYFFIHRN